MARSFAEAIIGARDVTRCLMDKGLLKFPIPVSREAVTAIF